MAEESPLHEDPGVAAAMRDTLELYDVYICGQCRLLVGRHERHDCQAVHCCKEV